MLTVIILNDMKLRVAAPYVQFELVYLFTFVLLLHFVIFISYHHAYSWCFDTRYLAYF
jgi:hypothetical protein